MPDAEPEPDGIEIACALDGATAFVSKCTVETLRAPGGPIHVLHRGDGGFRRVGVDRDGRYVALDGADPVDQRDTGEGTYLRIADDTFLITLTDEPLGMYD